MLPSGLCYVWILWLLKRSIWVFKMWLCLQMLTWLNWRRCQDRSCWLNGADSRLIRIFRWLFLRRLMLGKVRKKTRNNFVINLKSRQWKTFWMTILWAWVYCCWLWHQTLSSASLISMSRRLISRHIVHSRQLWHSQIRRMQPDIRSVEPIVYFSFCPHSRNCSGRLPNLSMQTFTP